MAKIHSKNTKPEMLVRKIVFGMGYRYRLHRPDLPGKPDMVFIAKKSNFCSWMFLAWSRMQTRASSKN